MLPSNSSKPPRTVTSLETAETRIALSPDLIFQSAASPVWVAVISSTIPAPNRCRHLPRLTVYRPDAWLASESRNGLAFPFAALPSITISLGATTPL